MDSSASTGLVGVRALRRGFSVAFALAVLLGLPSAAAAAPPPNDDFADPQELTSQNPLPIEVDGTTAGATVEEREPGHLLTGEIAMDPALHSVWYEWRPDVDGPVTVDARGGLHCGERAVVVYRGSQLDALDWVAGNYAIWTSWGYPGGELICLDSFQAEAGQTYRIAVDSYGEGPFELRLREANSPPNDDFADAQIVKQDGERIVLSGSTIESTHGPGDYASPFEGFNYQHSVWFEWRPIADGGVTFPNTLACITEGAPDTPRMSVFTGTSLDGPSRIAFVEQVCSRSTVMADAAKTYRIKLDSGRRDWRDFNYVLTQELSCRGRTVTIAGTRGPDRLRGTPGRDVIASFGGSDRISARAGHDLVCAGAGNDTVRGGIDKDEIRGERGRDRLFGGRGPDKLFGGKGRDTCKGGKGSDFASACEMELGI